MANSNNEVKLVKITYPNFLGFSLALKRFAISVEYNNNDIDSIWNTTTTI